VSRWLAIIFLVAHVLPVPASADLVGHWSFNAGSGTTAWDDSTYENHGGFAASASVPSWISSELGGALHFDGVAARVDVPDSGSLDLTGPFTLLAWIRPEAVGTQYLIKKASHGVSDGFELSLSSDGYVFFRVNQVSAGDSLRLESTLPHPVDGATWMHVFVSFDGDRFFLYLNGEYNGTLAAPNLSIGANDEPLSFGGQRDGSAPYRGGLDEVYLFDRALDETEFYTLPGVPTPILPPVTEPAEPTTPTEPPAPPPPPEYGDGTSASSSTVGEFPTPASEAQTGARQLFVKQGTECVLPYPRCGTEGLPFDDIDLCAAALYPGETCWVMDGYYYLGIDDSDGSPYEPERSGTESQRIAFRAYPGDHPTIGNAPGVTWHFGMRTSRHYVTFDGFRIQGVLRVHGDNELSRAVGVVIENCEIWGGGGKDDGNWSGIFAQFVEDLTIRNNVIRSIRSPSGGPSESAKGISIFNGRRTIVENNRIEDNPSEGVFDKEGGEDNIYRRNLFVNNVVGLKINNQGDSQGVQNERTQIYENVFVCDVDGLNESIRLLVQPTDWVIRNNSGYECKGIVVRSNSGAASGGIVYNNIWWSSTAETLVWKSQNGDDREPDYMDYNLYPPYARFRENIYTSDADTFYSLSEWRSVPHPRWYDANSFEGDPLFVDPENGDFHLAVGSPAIGAGLYNEDLGAYPLGGDGSVGPSSDFFECFVGALSNCEYRVVITEESVDLACGGDCTSIPAFPIQGVALGALALGLLEIKSLAGRRRRRRG